MLKMLNHTDYIFLPASVLLLFLNVQISSIGCLSTCGCHGVGSWRICSWVTVLIGYCMVHGQLRGCNLTRKFTAGLWMTVKLPSLMCVINLVQCRINVIVKMTIYHLKLRRDCVWEVNSSAQGIGEGRLEGRGKIPACIVSQVHSQVTLMRIAL